MKRYGVIVWYDEQNAEDWRFKTMEEAQKFYGEKMEWLRSEKPDEVEREGRNMGSFIYIPIFITTLRAYCVESFEMGGIEIQLYQL